MQVRCTNIEWDTEGETLDACGLPTECTIDVAPRDPQWFIPGIINDEKVLMTLAEEYGFNIYGCQWELVSSPGV